MKKVNSATYVDGYVLLVPKEKLPAYKKMARQGSKIWKKYGALEYKECIGDDMNISWGLPFPKLTGAKSTEVVVFAYITYKNKTHRNQVNTKVMKEMDKEAEKYKDMPIPFDMQKMAYGGFKVIVS